MDAILGLPNVNVVEKALISLNGASVVVVKIEPRASKRGWRPSRHIMTLLPTRAQVVWSKKAGSPQPRLDAGNVKEIYFRSRLVI